VTGHGLEELRQTIAMALLERDTLTDPPAITNVRHVALVETAREGIDRAQEALTAGSTEEMALVDLARARAALEEITGRRAPDDLLLHIFTRFCIGK
jgi:tRNA modification GTPase